MKYFLSLLLSIFPHALTADKIVLATHNLPPYGSYSQQGQVKKIASDDFSGIAVDRIKCAFLKMNQPLQILVVPWARAQYLAEKKAVDGFFAGSQNNDRDSYAEKSAVVAEQKWKWYWLKKRAQNIESPSTLKRIGSFRGSNMSKWLKAKGYPIYSYPKTTEQLLLQLKYNRIDLFIGNNLVTEKLLDEYNMIDQVESKLIKDKSLYLYITKHSLIKHPSLLDDFNKSLAVCYQQESIRLAPVPLL